MEHTVGGTNAIKLLDLLFNNPAVTVREVADGLKISRVAANNFVKSMVRIGIFQEITGIKRYQTFAFVDFIKIIEKRTRI